MWERVCGESDRSQGIGLGVPFTSVELYTQTCLLSCPFPSVPRSHFPCRERFICQGPLASGGEELGIVAKSLFLTLTEGAPVLGRAIASLFYPYLASFLSLCILRRLVGFKNQTSQKLRRTDSFK
jgi:hypothetical protein